MKRSVGRRILGWTAVVLLAGGATFAVWIYQQLRTLDAESVTPDVWMLSGLGGKTIRSSFLGRGHSDGDFREPVHPLAVAGRTLDETLEAVDLREDEGYTSVVLPGIERLDRDFVVRRAWEEATGAVEKRVDTDGEIDLASAY